MRSCRRFPRRGEHVRRRERTVLAVELDDRDDVEDVGDGGDSALGREVPNGSWTVKGRGRR